MNNVKRILLLCCGLFLSAATSFAQSQSPGTSAVSPSEVTAFMQSFQKDARPMPALSANPQKLPLLLGAISREPAGYWTRLLLGLCFEPDRVSALNLAPAARAAAFGRMLQYLSTARNSTVKALEADPQNRALKSNLALLEEALLKARAEAGGRQSSPAAGIGSASNVVTPAKTPLTSAAGLPKARAELCASQLKQIDLAKQMWKADNNKPDSTVPRSSDLTVYLPYRKFPVCPSGGTYSIGKLNEEPRCSTAGHSLASPRSPEGR